MRDDEPTPAAAPRYAVLALVDAKNEENARFRAAMPNIPTATLKKGKTTSTDIVNEAQKPVKRPVLSRAELRNCPASCLSLGVRIEGPR